LPDRLICAPPNLAALRAGILCGPLKKAFDPATYLDKEDIAGGRFPYPLLAAATAPYPEELAFIDGGANLPRGCAEFMAACL